MKNDHACRPGSLCAQRNAAAPMQDGVVCKLKMTCKDHWGKGDTWDTSTSAGNPCTIPLHRFLLNVYDGRREAGGSSRAPSGCDADAHPPGLVAGYEVWGAAGSLSLARRTTITRGIALFSLAFASLRRGHDLSFTLGSQVLRSQVLRLPESQATIFNFQFG